MFIFAAALLVCSLVGCQKKVHTPELKNPELGEEFQSFGNKIDMSQSNKFDEALFCGTWVVDRQFGVDVYVDGQLQSSEMHQNDHDLSLEWTLNEDHTMIEVVGGDKNYSYKWLYVHNYLMMYCPDLDHSECYEVVDVKDDVVQLCYWRVLTPEGGYSFYYYPVMKGEAERYVFKFKAKR